VVSARCPVPYVPLLYPVTLILPVSDTSLVLCGLDWRNLQKDPSEAPLSSTYQEEYGSMSSRSRGGCNAGFQRNDLKGVMTQNQCTRPVPRGVQGRALVTYGKQWVKQQRRMSATSNQETVQVGFHGYLNTSNSQSSSNSNKNSYSSG